MAEIRQVNSPVEGFGSWNLPLFKTWFGGIRPVLSRWESEWDFSEASIVWPMDFYSCRFEVSHWHQGIGWVHRTPFLLAIGSWRIGTCRGKSQGEAWRRSRGPLEIPDFEKFEIPLPIQTYWLDISSKSISRYTMQRHWMYIYIYIYKAQNDWQILSYSNHPASLWLLFILNHLVGMLPCQHSPS